MFRPPCESFLSRIADTKCLLRYLLALVLASCTACSRSGIEVIPVAGNVTFEGREQPAVCRLLFLPSEPAGDQPIRPSIAQVRSNGEFNVTPFQGTRGLVPGTYQVRVTYYDLKPGGDPNLETSWIAHHYDAPELQIDPDSSRVEYVVSVPDRQ